MKPYRKTDQEYSDDYDRYTIKRLKELEQEYGEKLNKKLTPEEMQMHQMRVPSIQHSPHIYYHTAAVHRAQNRDTSIRSAKLTDENKDKLVKNTSVPKNIRCKTCASSMILETYRFNDDVTQIQFVFMCPDKHSPKRIVFPDGHDQYVPSKITCKKCGGDISTETIQRTDYLKFTDTCSSCGDITIQEFKLDPELSITNEDRKKYCTDWIGKHSFQQDLEAIDDFMKTVKRIKDENEIKEIYKVDEIEKIKVPNLEQRLSEITAAAGFIKFKFESISTKGLVVARFSVQDPSDKTEQEILKYFRKLLNDCLFKTQWRLQSGTEYRLGVITGRLKAFEADEDLLKIAKEIHEKSLEK